MSEIQIAVNAKIPSTVGTVKPIVANNSDYVVRFSFDDEWDDGAKTVIYVREDGYAYAPVRMVDNVAPIPRQQNGGVDKRLYIGVVQGDLRTSRAIGIPVVSSVADIIDDGAVATEPDMWEGMLQRIMYLEDNPAVFWVEYGKTKFAEIVEAMNAGKLCVLPVGSNTNREYRVAVDAQNYISSGAIHFAALTESGTSMTHGSTTVKKDDTWSDHETEIITRANLVNTITDEASSKLAPSAYAVLAAIKAYSGVYIVRYGEVSAAEILEAIKKGKLCVLRDGYDFMYPERYNDGSAMQVRFINEEYYTGVVDVVTVDSAGWRRSEYISYNEYHRALKIDENSTDDIIPTAKAVYDALPKDYLKPSALDAAIETALTEAKESGEFDGKDYVLTDEDKQEIANMIPGGGGTGGGGSVPAGTDLVGHAMVGLAGASYDALEMQGITFPPDVTDEADQQRMLRAGAVKAVVSIFESEDNVEAGVLDCIEGDGLTWVFAGVMVGKNRTAFVTVTSIEDSNEYEANVLAVHEGGSSSGGDAMRLKVLAELPYEGTPPIIDMIDFSRKYTFADIAEAFVAGRTITLHTEYDVVPYQYGMFWLERFTNSGGVGGLEFHGHYWRVPDVEADVDEGWVPAVAFLREDGTLTIEDREWSGYAKQAEVDKLSKAIADKADAKGWTPNKYLGTDANGNLVEKDAPSGGGSSGGETWELIEEVTTTELTHVIQFTNLDLKRIRLTITSKQERTDGTTLSGDQGIQFKINGKQAFYNLNKCSSSTGFKESVVMMDMSSGFLDGIIIPTGNQATKPDVFHNISPIYGNTITSIALNAVWASGNVQVFSIGTKISVYGVRA